MMNCKLLLTLLGALAIVSTSSLCAQEEIRVRAAKAETPTADTPAKSDDEDGDEWLHIHNVDVYPVVGPVIRGGEILIKNGKIEAVGMDLDVPEGAETLDGNGHRAYPGLVALNAQGLVPRASGDPSFTSAPNSLWTLLGLSSGITTVVSGSTAVKLQRASVDDYVLRRNLFTPLFYSSNNPKAKAQLRKDLRKVYEYLRRRGDAPSARERRLAAAKAKADSGKTKSAPKKKPAGGANAADAAARKALGSAARYLPLMKGEAVAVFNANDAAEIRAICELVETFRFRAVIRGAVEGWTVAGDMGRAGVSAIISPRVRQDPDANVSRPTGSTIANAAILHDHGVRVAIAAIAGNVELDGGAGRDAISLPYSAGAAVRGGLPERAAIGGVTLEAARTYGLDDRIGSIEPGKDADLVICDGELLHYATHVQWAVVNGRICYDKQADYSFLREIRPRRGEQDQGSGAQWWPRRFGEMADDWSYDPEADWKRRNPAPEPKPEGDKPEEKGEKKGEAPKSEKVEPKSEAKKDKVSSGGQ